MKMPKVKIPKKGRLFLLGAVLMEIYVQLYIHDIHTDLAKLFLPIVILPNLILNCISDLGNFNWSNIVSYLRLVQVDSTIDHVLFVIIGGVCFSELAKCYMGVYKFKNKLILFTYSFLFWILIIHHTIVTLPKSFPIVPVGGTIDQFAPDIFLEILISVISIIAILRIISGEFSVLYYMTKYVFLIVEMMMGLYVGIAFINWRAGSNVTDNQLILVKFSIIIMGFALFIILEIIRGAIDKYLKVSNLK